MTPALLASLVLSAVCGLAVAGLFLAWPPPRIYWLGFPERLPDPWPSNPVLRGSA
jgi:hypothetical protein